MHLFSIEGNIGSGKSTFIDNLKNRLKHVYGIPVIYVPEPVEEWESIQSTDGKNMIELFYSDPKQYAFAFQMMAYITRLVYLKKEMKKIKKLGSRWATIFKSYPMCCMTEKDLFTFDDDE